MSEEILTALQQAVAGLLYSTESDEPFEVLQWPGCAQPLGAEDVLSLGGHALGTPVTRQSLDEFFASLVQDKDWYGDEERATAARYRSLRALLRQKLPDAQVFRVGKVEVAVYVVGHADGDRCLALKTAAVET